MFGKGRGMFTKMANGRAIGKASHNRRKPNFYEGEDVEIAKEKKNV